MLTPHQDWEKPGKNPLPIEYGLGQEKNKGGKKIPGTTKNKTVQMSYCKTSEFDPVIGF
jgi:hypothetical protein